MRCTTLALALCAASGASAQTLVPRGATWRYLDNGSGAGSGWAQPSFDDSGWAAGPAQLGYGDGDEATVVSYGPSSSNKYVTTWYRHSFQVANPGSIAALRVELQRDDGAVVYLNGVELLRDQMPAGAVNKNTLASHSATGANENSFFPSITSAAGLVAGQNVLAVEIHQVKPDSSDTSFDLSVTGLPTDAVVRGPYLQRTTTKKVVIRWRTAGATDGLVRFGLQPTALTGSVASAAVGTEHEVTLTQLTPGTRYYYSIGTSSKVLAGGDLEHRFVTAPPVGSTQPSRIWVVGDSGTANTDAAAVRDAYLGFAGSNPADLMLMLGDNAYDDGTDAQYQAAVFDMFQGILRNTVVWPTRGNHDKSSSVYYGVFTLPAAGQAGGLPSGTEAYYSFDWGNVHFVCLDSESSDRQVGGAMWTWVQADLAATNQEWIVAFWHHPPYSRGTHDSDVASNLVQMRERFLPLLEDGGVDLVLGGHSHGYERSYLIDGHYGLAATFAPSMLRDGGNGRPGEGGAYAVGSAAHEGTVYVVAGSSGTVSSGPYDHPVMIEAAGVLGSLVLDVQGGRLDARFLREDGTVHDSFTLVNSSYAGEVCRPKTSAAGCAPRMSASGSASASSTAPFLVDATAVPSGKAGILIYGFAPAALPFQAGTLCIEPPIRRTPLQSSGGLLPCDGSFSIDFNQRIAAGTDPQLSAGATVWLQYWFRDGGAPFGTGLSDALQTPIAP